jgi:PAS domain S-box-containing protein
MGSQVARRNPTVRLHLLIIALAALLPVWGLAGYIAWRMAAAERASLISDARDTTRNLAFTLERELLGLRGALTALGTSPALRQGDLATLLSQARAIRRSEGADFRLEDASGQVLFDTGRNDDRPPAPLPGTAPAPPEPPRPSGLATIRPADSAMGPSRVEISQEVPRGNAPPVMLTVSTDPARVWTDALLRAELPPGWFALIADADGRLIARVPFNGMEPGRLLSPGGIARQTLNSGEPEGWNGRGRTRSGRDVYTAWHRVGTTEWLVLVGLPADVLDGALRRALLPVLLFGGLVLLSFTLLLAFWVDRRLALPLGRLGRMAGAFGRGAPLPPFVHTGLREIDSVAEALLQATRQRQALEEQRLSLAARLQMVLESTTDSVLVLDADWRILYLNGRARAQLGGSADMVGQLLNERFPGWASGHFAAACRRAEVEGRPQSVTAFHAALGRWISADAYPSAEGLTVFFRDVSDERAAQAALRESEARLKAVMDNAPVGMLLAEAPSGRILLGNRRLEEILRHPVRLSADFAAYRDEWEAYHPDGRRVSGPDSPLALALQTGLPATGEYRYRRGDGSLCWLRIAGAPVRDAKGRVTGAVVAVTDIDEERRAAQALRESELRFRTLAEVLPQVVWSTLPDGTLDYVNPRLRDYTGLSGEIAAQALPRIVHPRDQARAERAWRRARRLGQAFSAELRLLRPDGGWRWCVVSGLPARLADGSIRRWIGTATDVSELVEAREALARQMAAQIASREAAVQAAAALGASESRFRRFAEASPDVLWMRDPETGALEFVSPAFEQIWGIPVERLMRMPSLWTDSLYPADRDRVRVLWAAAGRDGKFEAEYRVLRPDGGMRWIRDTGFPILDAQGGLARRGGLARDITDAKAAEARQALLLGELNHRVKNTLSTVHSLALQTARTAGNSPDALPRFLQDFQSRILTLSRAHDLLTARTWRGATLEETARAALAPWRSDSGEETERMTLSGPAVWLAPRQALGLALALHELATNANKHGALAGPEGRILVVWQAEGDDMVALVWQEQGGPPARPPTRRGFGSRMLERGLPAELGPGSSVTMDYADSGFSATIRFSPVNGPQVEKESV